PQTVAAGGLSLIFSSAEGYLIYLFAWAELGYGRRVLGEWPTLSMWIALIVAATGVIAGLYLLAGRIEREKSLGWIGAAIALLACAGLPALYIPLQSTV